MWFIAGSSGVQTTVGWGGAPEDIPLTTGGLLP
jgi:hypothetical protein